MNTYQIEIPYIVPSNNQQIRMHFHQRTKIKQRLMEELLVAKSAAKHAGLSFPYLLKRYKLTIKRHAPGPAQDLDNQVAAHKILIDAMKEYGGMAMVLDDGVTEMLELVVIQTRCQRKHQRTIIKLTEVT